MPTSGHDPKKPEGFRELPLQLPALRALYARVGEKKIHDILHDFYRRMAQDVMIGYFFEGKNLDEIAEKQASFLMRVMGATATYSGKAPADAHTALPPILTGHFDRRLKILEETLKDHALEEHEIETWLTFENAFRAGIVKT